jgi:adenylate kinase family enzyme
MTEDYIIKEAITAGEMVSKESLDKMIHRNLLQLINKKGVIIDGFPRDMAQILDFQETVSMTKTCDLLVINVLLFF